MFLLPRCLKRKAKKKARQILSHLSVNSPPVPMAKIMRRLGITVEEAYLPDMDGVTLKDGRHVGVFVQESLPFRRRQMTLAHELGHVVLGHLGARGSSRNLSRRHCNQANVFAMEVLVPESLLKKEVETIGGIDLKELADRFEVPVYVIKTQLAGLGYLKESRDTSPSPEIEPQDLEPICTTESIIT